MSGIVFLDHFLITYFSKLTKEHLTINWTRVQYQRSLRAGCELDNSVVDSEPRDARLSVEVWLGYISSSRGKWPVIEITLRGYQSTRTNISIISEELPGTDVRTKKGYRARGYQKTLDSRLPRAVSRYLNEVCGEMTTLAARLSSYQGCRQRGGLQRCGSHCRLISVVS
jgi:hypothetical protein